MDFEFRNDDQALGIRPGDLDGYWRLIFEIGNKDMVLERGLGIKIEGLGL